MMHRAFTQPQNACHKHGGVGFTLVETLVVIAITALISITLGVLLSYFYKTNQYTLEQSTAVAHARTGIEDAMRYLREASYGSDGSYPVESVSTSSIVFYANVNTDVAIERVTYSLQGGTLYRTVTEPAGNPPSYVGSIPATTTVATAVVNDPSTPVFQYYDNTGTELTAPVNVSKIASVKTTVVIDVNANRAPVSFTLSGGATLRNLKVQL
ncbi:MAG: PulJ/GspJ family protein [Minisyncoccota bacterium]